MATSVKTEELLFTLLHLQCLRIAKVVEHHLDLLTGAISQLRATGLINVVSSNFLCVRNSKTMLSWCLNFLRSSPFCKFNRNTQSTNSQEGKTGRKLLLSPSSRILHLHPQTVIPRLVLIVSTASATPECLHDVNYFEQLFKV